MSKQTAADLLSKVPLFSSCSKKELAAIARSSDQLSVGDGYTLTTQDESSREAFVLLTGKAIVKRNGRKVAELGPGDSVGELGLLDHGVRTATVVTDGPAEILVVGPREFSALLSDVPSLSKKLLQHLAATVRELDTKSYG
ncbi:cyclic nucleotide-binding domain-containing protein [Acidimicrobiia bacterium EGI L10123]|uniref:cyclic nucleotide-binding domain-containing protein n=1 Tax=Salinilacustrithrix flava TaxID=2957203 RepID=UPI003D7C26C4|nr:cyclic nucleotide-binding domain-containing protein [Acidimicrobiia bacterium EGI L10123]